LFTATFRRENGDGKPKTFPQSSKYSQILSRREPRIRAQAYLFRAAGQCVSLSWLVAMDCPMAIAAKRLKILWPMGTAMRPVDPVMDLQTIGRTAACAPPPMLIQHLTAVQSIDGIHQPDKSNAFFLMLHLNNHLVLFKCT
jgi:hypothetical protein